jgi:L-amino acid N-acyltransferase YncA
MEIQIRSATLEDSQFILELRNHDFVVKNSISGKKIDKLEHKKWLKQNLLDNNFYMYVAEIEKIPIGICRFAGSSSFSPNTMEVSIMLKPELAGKGIGNIFLQKICSNFEFKYRKSKSF